MTEDLNDLFQRRADRAQPPADSNYVLETVRAGAQRRERVTRNRLAVGSGALIVVAASALTLVFAPGHGDSHPNPAGGQPTTIATTPVTATNPQLRAKEVALAKRQAEIAACKAKEEQSKATLVPIDPAPENAEISIGLVPKGFGYLSRDSADTYYGLPGTPDQPNYYKEIVVDVHLSLDGMSFPTTIDGKPGLYNDDCGTIVVRIKYNNRIDVGFQAPPNAHLTKSQALKIASTIDVRSTKHTTKG